MTTATLDRPDTMTATATSGPSAICPECLAIPTPGHWRATPGGHPWVCPSCMSAGKLSVLLINGESPADIRHVTLPADYWTLPPAHPLDVPRGDARCRNCRHVIITNTALALCRRYRGGRWLNRRSGCTSHDQVRED